MNELVGDLQSKIQQIQLGGGAAARQRHLSRKKLLPRDRIDALLDPG